MKIKELIKESLNDEWDEEDEVVADPDSDKVPHIVMQIKKALDVGGRSPILFRDGTKVQLPLDLIHKFIILYSELKPFERERIQDLAAKSKDDFVKIVNHYQQ